jgi:hypothetical protein
VPLFSSNMWEETNEDEANGVEQCRALLDSDQDSSCCCEARSGDNDTKSEEIRSDDVSRFDINHALALMQWLGLLLISWLVTKGTCLAWNLPSGCNPGFKTEGAMEDLQMLLLFGMNQGYITGATDPVRSAYLFNFRVQRGWWFSLTIVVAGPIFSALGQIQALQHSITPGGGYLMISIALICLLLVLGWHLAYTWSWSPNWGSQCGRTDAVLYTISRIAVLLFYGVTVAVGCQFGSKASPYTFHVHHYLIAYALSLFASYRHPVSMAILATSTGVFVQGLGAYNYASFFEKKIPMAVMQM